MKLITVLSDAKKAVAAAAAAVGVAVSTGLLHGTTEHYVTGGIAVAGAFLVYLVPNGTAAPVTANPTDAAALLAQALADQVAPAQPTPAPVPIPPAAVQPAAAPVAGGTTPAVS